MSGFAGQQSLRKRKQEKNTSNGCARNFWKENADHAAGRAALTADPRRKNGLNNNMPAANKVFLIVAAGSKFKVVFALIISTYILGDNTQT